MYKRIMTIVMVVSLISSAAVFARGAQEEKPQEQVPVPVPEVVEPAQKESAPAPQAPAVAPQSGTTEPSVELNLAVFAGPTGFGFARLIEDGPDLVDGLRVSSEILPTPTEAIARITSGDVDVVAMPVNLAASLYNKGLDVKLAAVTGEGMLYLVSGSREVSADLQSFIGETIHVPGAGSTPEYVPRYVFEENGIAVGSDVVFDLSLKAASQLAQMLIAGKVDHAVLPEPFATMAVTKNPALRRVVDLQSAWAAASGEANYPMTAMLVRGAFLEEHPQAVDIIRMAAADSIDWVNANHAAAAELIEKHGILSAALAEPAIPNCSLIYIDAADARSSIEAYLSVLGGYAPASIGGSLPDEAFYLAK